MLLVVVGYGNYILVIGTLQRFNELQKVLACYFLELFSDERCDI